MSAEFKHAKNQFNDDVSHIKDKTCEACGAFVDTAKHVRDNAQDIIQPSIDELKEKHENMRRYIKANPMQSLGLALLAGVFIAKVL
jgi:ElaB/YqjD/DUF883 family membrane-anchored ribosome-binding protein